MTLSGTWHLAPDVLAQKIGDGFVLVHLVSNKIFELNETASRFWELLGTGSNLAEIVDQLCTEFEVDSSQVESEINAMLLSLQQEGLICDDRE